MQGELDPNIRSVFDKPTGKSKRGPGKPKNPIKKKRKHYYLTTTTIGAIEKKANDLGLDYSVLVERILKYGLKNIKLIDVYND